MSEPRSPYALCFASPALRQLSISPIPEQIKDNLALPACSVSEWSPITQVRANMWPAAEGHLHLRRHIPICLCPGHKIAVGDKFDHRRPQAAEAMVSGKALSEGSAPVKRLWRDISTAR